MDRVTYVYPVPGAWAPLESAVEEGVEMFGPLLLLVFAVGLYRRQTVGELSHIEQDKAGLRLAALPAVLAVVPMLWVRGLLAEQGTLELQRRGDFGSAPAVTLLAVAGGACLVHACDEKTHTWWWRMLSLVYFLASLELACHLIAWVRHESVMSLAHHAPVQLAVVVVSYGLVWRITRPVRPGTGPTPGPAA